MSMQPIAFPLTGGMDLITPAVSLPPGRVIASLNYEPVAAGYKRMTGFERFSGQLAPSDADYLRVSVTGASGWTVAVGGTFTIAGTTYTLLYKDHATAPTVIIIWHVDSATKVSGSAIAGTGGTGGTTSSTMSLNASVTDLSGTTSAALTSLAAAATRALIGVVPGSGDVRGVALLPGGQVVAFRNNSGGTACVGHFADDNGWNAIDIARVFTFNSGGTYDPTSTGTTATGATSAAVGAIRVITVTSGTWAGGDAAGTISITVSSGTFSSGENINVDPGAHSNTLTITNAGTVYAFPAGGSYEFVTHNFYGASDLTRLYGVNGVGNAFVYSDLLASLTIISTGMTTDTPTHIAEHKGSLFLSFTGGSVQFSTVGDPLTWDAIVGAGEIGIGDEIVDFVSVPNALAIFGDTSIHVLYGNDSTDYQLETLTREAGSLAYTAQRFGNVIYMDNRGLRSLATTQAYGNFSIGTLSKLIEPLLKDYRIDGVDPVASLVCRTSDQYWLFFDNGAGIVVYMGGKQPAILPFNLGVTVSCACSVEDDGIERMFIGCTNGFVYELNKGTSFDGAVIEHYLRLPFNHFGSPQMDKRVHKVMLDLEAAGTTTLSVSLDMDYGSVDSFPAQTVSVTTGGAGIDSLGSNELYYASQIETIAEAYVDGVAKNFSLKIAGSSATQEPHTATGVTYLVSARRLRR